MIPNRIVLIARGRHDEAVCDAAVYPGMFLIEKSNTKVVGHNVAGGKGPLLVCKEDALKGGTTKGALTAQDVVPFNRAARGDKYLMLLQNGQSVTKGAALMSAGDGTLMSNPGTILNKVVAASTTITNTNTETTFSNGTYTIPANFLQVGDIIHIRAKAFCIAENSTNTHRVRMYIGSTTLNDSTALQLAAGDVAIFDMYLTIRTITSSGTFVADGSMDTSVAGTHTTVGVTVASTTIDSTATQAITVKSLASAASTGNQIRLDEFTIEMNRADGLSTIVYADETVDNSGGTGTSEFNTAAFIRVMVP